MIGTFLRFLFLRVIGARGAVILAVLGFLLGRRRSDRSAAPDYRRRPETARPPGGPEDRSTTR